MRKYYRKVNILDCIKFITEFIIQILRIAATILMLIRDNKKTNKKATDHDQG